MERVATGYGLIEGPVWDATRGLYFSDVLNGGVFLLDRAGKVTPAIERRRGIVDSLVEERVRAGRVRER